MPPPIRRTRQRRVAVDELWIEIPIDGGQAPLSNKALMNLRELLFVWSTGRGQPRLTSAPPS
jgi:hypothetical protein